MSHDETGRIYSIYTLAGALLSSLASSAFQKIYNLTLDSLPGAYLLVVSVISLLAIPFNLVMRRLLKTFKSDIELENTDL